MLLPPSDRSIPSDCDLSRSGSKSHCTKSNEVHVGSILLSQVSRPCVKMLEWCFLSLWDCLDPSHCGSGLITIRTESDCPQVFGSSPK